MSLSINTNIAAMSAHRWMQTNNESMAKSVERLSSGFRINSAADDAAGLVISENLQTQVEGLTQSSKNVQDAANMFKTAEKSLDEVEKQLRNIRDLTLHSAANYSNTSIVAADEAQVEQATSSINRIADQTEFAGVKLLSDSASGNLSNKFFQIGANSGQQATFTLGSYDGVTLTADMHVSALNLTTNAGATGTLADAVGGTWAAVGAGKKDNITINWTQASGEVKTFDASVTAGGSGYAAIGDEVTDLNTQLGTIAYTSGVDSTVSKLSDVMEAYDNGSGAIGFRLKDVMANQGEKTAGSTLQVQSLAEEGATVGAQFGVPGVSASGTSTLTSVKLTGVNSKSGFDTIINGIDNALKLVNGLRVNLGAFQKNNLESALSSINVSKENLSASESAIRDTDMADEMVNFTKSQILTQAAQSMMSQANQAPQNILQMLR